MSDVNCFFFKNSMLSTSKLAGSDSAERKELATVLQLVMSLYAVAAVRVNDQRRNDAWEEAKDAE